MPFHPLVNTTQVQVRYTLDNQLCMNTFHYLFTTLPGPATLYNLCVEVWNTIGVKMQRQCGPTAQFREVYARNMDRAIAEQAVYVLPPNIFGQRTGPGVANSEACQITTRTGFTGRSSHGAKRFSGFVEGDVNTNTLTSSLFNLLADLGLSIVANRLGTTFRPAVPSPRRGVSTLMTSAALLDSYIDSQKTRLPGHGR